MNWQTNADHTIYIKYGNKHIKIATSLISLDTIIYNKSDRGPGSATYPSK